MSHIFISYSHDDLEYVNRLVHDLEQAGLDVWFDQQRIAPGENWDAAIETALREARTILVVVSPASMTDGQVYDALDFALDNDQQVIVVLYRYALLLSPLLSLDWVDLSTENLYNENLDRLITLLHEKRFTDPEIPADDRYVNPAQLGRYMCVLSWIAAPFINADGQAPEEIVDFKGEWRRLADAVSTAGRVTGVPFALTRLMPPTLRHLKATLEVADYKILHLICYADGAAFHIENELGHTDLVFSKSLVNVLRSSPVRLLIVDAQLPPDATELLLEETSLSAIITLSDDLPREVASYFARLFYQALGEMQLVREAFDAAIAILDEEFGDEVQRFTLTFQSDLDNLRLEKPPQATQAQYSLINEGMPPMWHVPVHYDFMGHRRPLDELSQEIASTNYRQMAIYGLPGIGKSWLAAEYVARFGWRYPDGIVWVRVTDRTKSEDVIGHILTVLEQPADTNWATLRDYLRDHQVLLVLDQADEWGDRLEIGELADFIARLDNIGGTRVLLTARGPVQPLTYTSGTEENVVEALASDEASRLLDHLLELYDMSDEIDDQQAFLGKTHYIPWLIREGIHLVRDVGFETALTELSDYDEVSDIYEHFIYKRFRELENGPHELLRRLQGLPAGFDGELAQAVGGRAARDHLRELVHLGMLRREGVLYHIPVMVRSYLREYAPLTDNQQDQIDDIVIQQIDADQEASLNNMRAIIKRQLRPLSSVDPDAILALVFELGPRMREAGLSQELLDYLEQLLYRVTEATSQHARLLVEVAITLDVMGGRQLEAETVYKQALDIYEQVAPGHHAQARLAYGRHLMRTGQVESAMRQYQMALDMVGRGDDPLLAATVGADLGRAYLAWGRFEEALPHFEHALEVLHQQEAIEERTEVQADFAMALIHLNQLDRAQSMLDRALNTCESLKMWGLKGKILRQVAYIDQSRAGSTEDQTERRRLLAEAEYRLNEAVTTLLSVRNTSELAITYHDLGRLQARQRKFEEAESHVRMASDMFSRLGHRRNFAVTQITLGQILLLKEGDATDATERIRQALAMATQLDDRFTQKQAAESLVRIHRLQVRNARSATKQAIQEQIAHSRRRLEALGLHNYVKSLLDLEADLKD